MGDGEAIVGSAQYVVADGRVAEFAVVVGDDFQGQGLGRRLIHRLRLLAEAAGLAGIRGDVLSENRRMLAIVRDFGFTARRNPEDATVYDVWLALHETAEGYAGRTDAARRNQWVAGALADVATKPHCSLRIHAG